MINKVDAIRSLFKGLYHKATADKIDWKDGHETTDEENSQIDAEFIGLQSEDVVLQKRIKEYGTAKEQLEYIVENGVDAFISKQNQIKSDNPKS